jgi:hypothetical protein
LLCRRLAEPSVLCKSPVFGTFDKNRQFFDGAEMAILGVFCVQNSSEIKKNQEIKRKNRIKRAGTRKRGTC